MEYMMEPVINLTVVWKWKITPGDTGVNALGRCALVDWKGESGVMV
jgi:hypothetical protein